MRKIHVLCVAVFLVFAVAGCSFGKNSVAESEPYTDTLSATAENNTNDDTGDNTKSNSTSADAFVEPFELYSMNGSFGNSVNKALDVLTARCMKEKGFEYSDAHENNDLNTSGTDSTWGVTDPERAKVVGYKIPGSASTNDQGVQGFFDGDTWTSIDELAAKNENTRISQPEGYSEALFKTGGCDDQAADELYAGMNVDKDRSSQVGQLNLKTRTEAKSDPRILEVLSKWSECMKAQGYNYQTPIDEKPYPFPHDEEIATAVADATCKQQVGFIDVWQAVLTEREQDVINANLPLFEAEKAYSTNMINRAEEIIAKYGNGQNADTSEKDDGE
jgi:hypothetical protein